MPEISVSSKPSARLNVLFLVGALEVGGAEKHAVLLLNGLDPKRFACHLAYLRPNLALLPLVLDERRAQCWCVGVRSKIDWRAIRRLARFVDAHAIDAVMCVNAYPALYAFLARVLCRRRCAIVEMFHITVLASLKARLQMPLYRRVLARCDSLVYVSHAQQRYWQARGLRAAEEKVIHNGVDSEHYQDRSTAEERAARRKAVGFAPEDYVIGLCAALRPEKAVEDLIEALARLRDTGAPARALVIGDGPERARITAHAHRLGVSDSVAVTGFQVDVRPWIAACDVMVLTSHRVETFSLAALESMALGKPVVQTLIGGAAEQVAPGVHGFLYAPGDIDALVAHLLDLQEPTLRRRMGVAAAERVRREFSLETMVDQYAAHLARLVSA